MWPWSGRALILLESERSQLYHLLRLCLCEHEDRDCWIWPLRPISGEDFYQTRPHSLCHFSLRSFPPLFRIRHPFLEVFHIIHITKPSPLSNYCPFFSFTCTLPPSSFSVSYRDVTALIDADNDVVLISTPILSLSEVLRSMPLDRLKRPVLFVDVLSVKEYPRQALLQVYTRQAFIASLNQRFHFTSLDFLWCISVLISGCKALPEESDILCTHPMFGPQGAKDGWRGHNFMYEKVRIRNEDNCSNFLQIFASEVRFYSLWSHWWMFHHYASRFIEHNLQ